MADEFVTVQQFNELKDTLTALTASVQQAVAAKAPKPQGHNEPPVAPAPTPEPVAPVADPMQAPVTAQAFAELQSQITGLLTQNQDLQRQLQAQQQENLQSKRQRELDRVSNFVERMAGDGERKIKPSEKQAKIQMIMAMPESEQDFSDPATGRTVKKSARQMLMDQIAAGPELWSSGAMPIGPEYDPDFVEQTNAVRIDLSEVDHDSLMLDRKIRAFMSEQSIADYTEAYDRYTTAAGVTE